MSLPASLEHAIQNQWLMRNRVPLEITRTEALSGGCVNNVSVVEHTQGMFCVKYNTAKFAHDIFSKELKGLHLLVDTSTIRVPYAHDSFAYDGGACLMLEYLSSEPRKADFWQHFGRQLAALHRSTNTAFGLNHNNYIGRLPQSNLNHPKFCSFFWCERLEPQLKRAQDKGLLSSDQVKQFEVLQWRTGEICPDEPPALIHGDLWSGNFITGPDGYAALIDPAVAYSHRECDLAMTRLFGGFAPAFYAAYNAAFLLEPGFEQRVDFYNLYPLLVHVNLFGDGYVSETMKVVRAYI